MSQFDGLLDITKKKKPEVRKIERPKEIKPTPPPAAKTAPVKQIDKIGKSKNEDYTQTSIYIKRETQIAVKTRLLTDHKKRDFSELVEELLTGWLKS